MNESYESSATRLMTEGGDARIRLDPVTGLNRYHSAPRPSPVLAYASSTANDVSRAAFAHVVAALGEAGGRLDADGYRARLDVLRDRLCAAYALPRDTAIVFAPSGTDLEYVALALAEGRASGGIHNILLGADEVGSGCIHSAHGRYFAEATALAIPTRPGDPVPGLGPVEVGMVDIPVRDAAGHVRESAELRDRIDEAAEAAKAQGRHVIVHIVHGSKTGLILPSLEDVDILRGRHGDALTFVVDACQARITTPAIHDYLERDVVVFVTGSKFMGGPPFSGFAFVPGRLAAAAPPLPEGLATIFRRAEWPSSWPGAGRLVDEANAGLWLRLEAAIFDLERFQRLSVAEVERVILAFHAAVRAEIVEKTPAHRVAPYPPGHREEADTHPIEMRTLSTLDLSEFGGGASFDQATAWHRALVDHGVRLGQPVKCVRLANGAWGATLRVGLTMAQVVDRAALPQAELEAGFAADMARIREALLAVAAA